MLKTVIYDISKYYFIHKSNYVIRIIAFPFKIVLRLRSNNPVRIRVRIDSAHPLVCRKRRLNGAVLRMRPEKPRSRVTAGVAR